MVGTAVSPGSDALDGTGAFAVQEVKTIDKKATAKINLDFIYASTFIRLSRYV